MVLCKTCCDKGYIGLKPHECFGGMPANDRPCPDCANRAKADVSTKYQLVKLGNYQSSFALRTELNRAHRKMNVIAQMALADAGTIGVAPSIMDVHLKFVPFVDLHLASPLTSVEDVLLEGMNRGFRPVPCEVAPQFHLKYREPVPWRWLIFGMRSFRCDGARCSFVITNNSEGHSLRAVHTDSYVVNQYPPNNHSPEDVMTVWWA